MHENMQKNDYIKSIFTVMSLGHPRERNPITTWGNKCPFLVTMVLLVLFIRFFLRIL